jgi:hypothetical protein
VGAAVAAELVAGAEGALPGAPAGQVEPGPLVERAAALGPAPPEVVGERQVAERALAALARQPEPALLRGRLELQAGPGLPGSDPGHPAVTEVREVLEPPPPPEAQAVRVARALSPCWIS